MPLIPGKLPKFFPSSLKKYPPENHKNPLTNITCCFSETYEFVYFYRHIHIPTGRHSCKELKILTHINNKILKLFIVGG